MSGGFYAPPAGSRSGVADYAAALHGALRRFGPPPVNLYHLGNNGLHAAIYRMALERPGVVVLHDAVLHHFLLGTLSREEYIAEFVCNYGEWRRHLAEDLWEARGSSGIDPRYFEFPMLRRILERSKAAIVHNPGAARIVRAHGELPIHTIPHFFEPANMANRADAAHFRQRLGIGQGTTLFGILGYLRETKRVIPSIAAFRRLHAVRPDTALLLAGDPVSTGLKRLLDEEARHPAIHRLGHLSERGLAIASAAIDCCVNLRYPAAGETSGIAIRMMGIGKPVILTDAEETADLPPGACLRVQPGVPEGAELFDHMTLVTEMPAIARDIGGRASRHIAEGHSMASVAALYRNVLGLGGA